MIKQSLKRAGVLLSALFFFSTFSFSQIDNFDFLRSVPADGAKFLKAYMAPWTNAFGAGLNGGWYNTAKPHKLLGFDITTSINVGMVPSSEDKFEISSLGLTSITGSGPTPSVSGPDNPGPALAYEVEGYELATFNAPQGTGFKYIPVPTAQIGIGLPLGTELKARFIPKIRIRDGDISLWGVGLMHSLMQYLPGDKLLPFDVSLFGGYTKLQGNAPLSIQPDPSISNYSSPYNITTSFQDQKMNVTVSALTVSAIGSVNLPVITFYGGLGYSKTKTDMSLIGNYPLPTLVSTQSEYNNTGVKKGTDFGDIGIENFSGLRANIGFRIKLAVITIHADYTRAQYNVISAGFGISVR